MKSVQPSIQRGLAVARLEKVDLCFGMWTETAAKRYYFPIMASDRIQRRIDRILDQIEPEADQAHWQIVLELVGEVLDFDPEN